MIADRINGAFEFGMAIMLSMSVVRLWRDKRVHGWSVWSVVWPTLWGVWNLYYYPHLGQWCSFWGGLAVVVVNSTWIALAFKYQAVERQLQVDETLAELDTSAQAAE